MTEHDDRLPMHQMLDHARDGLDLVRGRERGEIRSNRMLQLALLHVVQVVGEAATRVSPAGRSLYPQIPWSQAIGARHRIVHDYDRIDYDVVWDTVELDFPPLVTALELALAADPS